MNFKLIAALVLLVLVVLFVVQNTAVMEIRFLTWTLTMSRALVIIFALIMGLICGWLLRGRTRRKQ